jgi:hypothetical protein
MGGFSNEMSAVADFEQPYTNLQKKRVESRRALGAAR